MATKKTAKRVITVLITDDHKMVRDGLKVMLNFLQPGLHFKITEAVSGADAIHQINHHEFDLLIIDYRMPGFTGAETVHRILRFKPDMKILALSSYNELAYIQSMMDAGASGFVLKNIEPAEMLNAITSILAGKIYYCSEAAVKLIDANQAKEISNQEAEALLTQREMEVLQMIAMEMTNEEIGKRLFVAKRTIDTHRQNLINKLQVKNTAGLVKVALRLKLVEVKPGNPSW